MSVRSSKFERFSRRRVLRGMLKGGAVTVGLPLLNCFLNSNASAMASGAPMPLRFGTWFWGLGMNAKVFVPSATGASFDLPEELAAIGRVKQHMNVYTNFNLAVTLGKLVILTLNDITYDECFKQIQVYHEAYAERLNRRY